MAISNTFRNASHAAGVATAAVPYLGKFANDQALRSSAKDLLKAVEALYDEVSGDVDRGVGSLRDAAHLGRRDTRSHNARTALIVGAGLGIAIGALLAAAVIYPRTRRQMARAMDEARERAAATARDAREKVSGTVQETREKASGAVHDAREKISGTVNDPGEATANAGDEAGETATA